MSPVSVSSNVEMDSTVVGEKCLPCNEAEIMNEECFSEDYVSGCSSQDDSVKHVVVGICSMEKKSSSKPMKEILMRLEEFEYITTCIFSEDTILRV